MHSKSREVSVHLVRTSDNTATSGTVLTLDTGFDACQIQLEVMVQPSGEGSICQVG